MATRNPRQFRDVFTEIFSGTITVDIASIAAGARGVSGNISVPGLLVTDVAIGFSSTVDPGNLIPVLKCTAADTAVLAFENNTAGAIDPANSTYTVYFGRPNPILAL